MRRRLVLILITALATAAIQTSAATAENQNWTGINIVPSGDGCGGTCVLKGVRGDVQVGDNWSIAADSGGAARVDVENIGGACGNCLFQAGLTKTNTWTPQGPCGDNGGNDTAPYIRPFYEKRGEGGVTCHVYTSSDDSTRNYRIQRTNYSSNNWRLWIDGVYKMNYNITDFSTGTIIAAGDEVSNNFLGSESVFASWPSNAGGSPWQRTDDIFDITGGTGGANTTWHTIGSSQCYNGTLVLGEDNYQPHWFISDDHSPFNVSWSDTHTQCDY